MCLRLFFSWACFVLATLLIGLTGKADEFLNVDFSAPYTSWYVPKVGKAAVGATDQDYWNAYSNLSETQTLIDMQWADGSASDVDLAVSGGGGAWGVSTTDLMFSVYHYADIDAQFTNLPDGTYDVYVYAHGEPDNENATIEVVVDGNSLGNKTTSAEPGWQEPLWVEGKQYVAFKNVAISATSTLLIRAKPDQTFGVLNGIQLVKKASQTPPSPVAPSIVNEPADVEVGYGQTAIFMVTVSGTSPLTYQWFKEEAALEGANGSQLIIENIDFSSMGLYSVIVSNSAGTVTSRAARLSLAPVFPVITKQPTTQTILLGATAVFSVEHQPNVALSYQWYFEGQLLPGANSSILEISQAQLGQAGNYHVVLSNPVGTVESVKARLFFFTPVVKPLLNVDYTAHLNPAFSSKIGPAAIGKTSSDYWNVWSRDTEEGGWQSDAEITNMRWSDGSPSAVRLAVANAAGAWYTLNSDSMFQSYLYPLGTSSTIDNMFYDLPKGNYDILVYAHGEIPSENAQVKIQVGNRFVPLRSTSNAIDWDHGNWTEGNQFIVFNNIHVNAGETLRITVLGGESSLPVINGVQLLMKNSLPSTGH